jgi:hypothetical protein
MPLCIHWERSQHYFLNHHCFIGTLFFSLSRLISQCTQCLKPLASCIFYRFQVELPSLLDSREDLIYVIGFSPTFLWHRFHVKHTWMCIQNRLKKYLHSLWVVQFLGFLTLFHYYYWTLTYQCHINALNINTYMIAHPYGK